MKTLRRVLCVILVAATLFGSLSVFASCKKNEKLPEKRTVSNAYKMKTIPLPDGVNDISWLDYNNGKLIFLGYSYDVDNSWTLLSSDLYELDPTTGDYSSTSINLGDSEWVNGIGRTSDGYIVVTSSSTWSDEEGYKETWYAYNYSNDGEIVNKVDLYDTLGLGTSDETTDDYSYVYINGIEVSENGDIVFFTNMYVAAVSPDGSQVKKYEFDDSLINGDSYVNGYYDCGEDQYMMVIVTWTYTETESSEKVEYRILDLASETLGEPQEFSQSVIDNGYYSMCTGNDPDSPYDFYFQDSDGISGYNMETDTFTDLLNWVNSDMTRGEIGSIIPVNADLFYGTAYDLDTYEMNLVSLTRIPDEEQVAKYIVTLAYEGYSYNITNAAVKFNRLSDEYRIELKPYDSQNSGIMYKDAMIGGVTRPVGPSVSSSEGSSDLRQDILTGNIPDILLVNEGMNIDSYINKGIFANIYDYMDKDETFDKSEYLTNIFEAFEVNGKLYELAPTFRIATLAAKTETLDGIQGWNTDEFIQFLSKFPEGTYASLDMTRSFFLEMVLACNYNTFVDRDTGKCYFDGEEFRKVLEYAKTLSETSVWDSVYGDEYDPELAESLNSAYRDGKALLYPMYLYDFSAYIDAAGFYTFGGTDVDFVGYPSSDRNGHAIMADNIVLAMSAQSHSVIREGVWEFFKYLLSESYQDPEYNYGGFPVKISSLEKMAEQVKEYDFGWQWYGDNGYWIDGGIDMPVVMPESSEEAPEEDVDEPVDTETDDDVIVEEPVLPEEPIVSSGREYHMTDEQINTVLDLIKSVKHVRVDNSELLSIITQESAAYFEGKKGLDETVDIIQSRAKIFINTNR